MPLIVKMGSWVKLGNFRIGGVEQKDNLDMLVMLWVKLLTGQGGGNNSPQQWVDDG